MKIALIGDTHIHKFHRFSFMDKGNHGRLVVINMALRRFMDDLPDDVKVIVHAGDVFHSRTHLDYDCMQVYTALIVLAQKKKIHWVQLCGNHDILSHHETDHFSSIKTSLEFLRACSGVTLINRACTLSFGSDSISFVPYVGNADMLKAALLDVEDTDLLVTHLDFNGFQLSKQFRSTEGLDPTIVEQRFPLICNGHMHIRQAIGRIQCLGSFVPTGLTEENQGAGYWIYDTVEKTLNFYAVNSPKFVKIHLPDTHPTKLPPDAARKTKSRIAHNFVRVLGNRTPEWDGWLKQHHALVWEWQPVTREKIWESDTVSSPQSDQMSIKEAMRKYVNDNPLDQVSSDKTLAAGTDIIKEID